MKKGLVFISPRARPKPAHGRKVQETNPVDEPQTRFKQNQHRKGVLVDLSGLKRLFEN